MSSWYPKNYALCS